MAGTFVIWKVNDPDIILTFLLSYPIKWSAASPHGLYRMGYTCNIRDYTNKKYIILKNKKFLILYTKIVQ
jgi:hypothetical protein